MKCERFPRFKKSGVCFRYLAVKKFSRFAIAAAMARNLDYLFSAGVRTDYLLSAKFVAKFGRGRPHANSCRD
jgi:hypothetical protein